jgi:ribosomal protein S1
MGALVVGTVAAVYRFGVLVDLGLDHMGFIDPIFIGDDVYEEGDHIEAYVVGFRAENRQYELRPKGMMSLPEWLRQRSKDNKGRGHCP